MKKILFGIFAHPDDEAFGPSASLYLAAQAGVDIHLVLVTDGEGGTNIDNHADLGSVRLKEWQTSGKIIGITSSIALHYPDGKLSNSLYHEIAEKIQTYITKTLASYSQAVEVDFMTFEPDGITGHIDHIAVSRITTYLYLLLLTKKLQNVSTGTLKYYCLPLSLAPNTQCNWLYMAPGKKAAELDEVVDFSSVANVKHTIMKSHYSQRQDMQSILASQSPENPDCLKDHFQYFKIS